MNRRQRIADSEMAYLGAAWRAGFWGPRERPARTNLWEQIRQQIRSIPREFNEERVWELHAKWLRVADQDKYDAVLLKLHYRDGYNFKSSEIERALDRFSRV